MLAAPKFASWSRPRLFLSRFVDSTMLKAVPEQADYFVASAVPLFRALLPILKKYYPQYYRKNVESAEIPGSAFFEIVFIRVESGVPAVAYRSFFAERDPQKRLVVRTERTDCPGSGCPDGTDFRVLGKNLAYRDFLASKQKFSGIPIDDINRTIQMETEREPDEVGGNINIISIDGLGAKWITNYGECAGQ